jgi:hypothetical protein
LLILWKNIVLSVGKKWLSLNYSLQCTLILILLLLRSPIEFSIGHIRDAYLPASVALPQPIGYFSASLGNLIIGKLLGIDSVSSWVVLHIFLLLICLAIVSILILKSDLAPRAAMVVIVAAVPVTSTLFSTIGRYDVITFLGAITLGLSRHKVGIFAGALIMSLGNPEQAILALICLLFISNVTELQVSKRLYKIGLALSLFLYLGIQVWMITGGVVANRISLLPYWLGLSLSNFLNAPFNSLWSWYGFFWFLVIIAFLSMKGPNRKWLLVSLLMIPGVATLITADGVRVFSLIVLPSLLVCCIWIIKRFVNNQYDLELFLGLLIILWVMIPIAGGGGYLWGNVAIYTSSTLDQLSALVFDFGKRVSDFIN